MNVDVRTIRQLLRRWQPRLGLEKFTIGVRLYEDPSAWPEDSADACAFIEPQSGYSHAELHLHKQRCAEDADGLERIIVHELCHVVLWPLSVAARDGLGDKQEDTWRYLMESAVEQFARALLAKRK